MIFFVHDIAEHPYQPGDKVLLCQFLWIVSSGKIGNLFS